MAKRKTIKKYDGKNVTSQTMSLRKTGDGLSKALEIDPIEKHIGDDITLVVRGKVASIQYKEQKDTDDLDEVVIVYGGTITVAHDEGVITDLLDAQEEKNRLAEEAKKGVQRIPGTPGAPPVDGDGDAGE